MLRNIIRIDEEKCDGCGQCVDACAEGAIQLINGKAKLVSESYCDGLGDCIGTCPQDAITMEKREAPQFDQAAVDEHLQRAKPVLPCGCPGTMARSLAPKICTKSDAGAGADQSSMLKNWPVQLHLLAPNAPYLNGAELLIAADCVGFALPGFHRQLLEGKVLVIACPKLDDTEPYLPKLTAIFANNAIANVHVAYMEVPCCRALVKLVNDAIEASGKSIPVTLTKIGIEGGIIETA